MLSRVAERVYWLARYLERIENTARLINVNSNLLFDLPKGVNLGWGSLVVITDSEEMFGRPLEGAEERQVLRFLILDQDNPISIMSSLIMARENARITREIIPSEAWELINDLYHDVKEDAGRATSRKHRHELLQNIIASVQQLTGMMAGCMSQREAYEFIRLGRNLERADMTSRIVDAGGLVSTTESHVERDPFENILWMSVLRSLSAYQMYRQFVPDRVNGRDVVEFLLRDGCFPRSVSHCLGEIETCLGKLPNSDAAQRAVGSARRKVIDAQLPELAGNELRRYLDDLQLNIADIHQELADTWFLPSVINE